MEEYITGTGQKLLVHDKKGCTGNCVIHRPSDHHMKDWPTNWRSDLSIMERICSHGIGHPDPDDLAHKKKVLGDGYENYAFEIHGCDGCCQKSKNL